jgi:hypothetical protein
MSGFTLYLADTTQQNGRVDTFNDQEVKTIIVQHEGRKGPDDAQVLVAPGFATVPVKGDRLLILDKSGELFAVAGSTQSVEESLQLGPGSRAVYSTDVSAVLKALIKLLADGTISISGESVSVSGDTTFNDTVTVGGAGAGYVALAQKVDLLWTTLYTLFTSGWVIPPAPDAGAALKAAFVAAFPTPPQSVAAAKTKTE